MSLVPPSLIKPDVTLSLTLSSTSPSSLEALKPEERGITLIQLLLTSAKHASSGNIHRADACLHQILQLASVTGDSIQRLAAHFASALAVRLVKRWPGLYKALNRDGSEKLELVGPPYIFRQAFPYLGFSYVVMTPILVQTLTEERVVHIIDLGSGDPKLWIPLFRGFASSANGPPHLKITCVHSNKVVLDKLGTRLVKEAESLGMAFQFNPLNISLRELTLDMLKVRSGEALAITSVLNLHSLLAEDDRVDAHFGLSKDDGVKACKQMAQFLAMVQSMSPKVFLLVEQESDHNLNKLGERFLEALYYYSAVFDSLDATFGAMGSSCEERIALEEMFGREIENIVAFEGLERTQRHERFDRWAVRFVRSGFRPVRLMPEPIESAKRFIESYGRDGYKIVSHRTSVMICWHDRPLYAVSAWVC